MARRGDALYYVSPALHIQDDSKKDGLEEDPFKEDLRILSEPIGREGTTGILSMFLGYCTTSAFPQTAFVPFTLSRDKDEKRYFKSGDYGIPTQDARIYNNHLPLNESRDQTRPDMVLIPIHGVGTPNGIPGGSGHWSIAVYFPYDRANAEGQPILYYYDSGVDYNLQDIFSNTLPTIASTPWFPSGDSIFSEPNIVVVERPQQQVAGSCLWHVLLVMKYAMEALDKLMRWGDYDREDLARHLIADLSVMINDKLSAKRSEENQIRRVASSLLDFVTIERRLFYSASARLSQFAEFADPLSRVVVVNDEEGNPEAGPMGYQLTASLFAYCIKRQVLGYRHGGRTDILHVGEDISNAHQISIFVPDNISYVSLFFKTSRGIYNYLFVLPGANSRLKRNPGADFEIPPFSLVAPRKQSDMFSQQLGLYILVRRIVSKMIDTEYVVNREQVMLLLDGTGLLYGNMGRTIVGRDNILPNDQQRNRFVRSLLNVLISDEILLRLYASIEDGQLRLTEISTGIDGTQGFMDQLAVPGIMVTHPKAQEIVYLLRK